MKTLYSILFILVFSPCIIAQTANQSEHQAQLQQLEPQDQQTALLKSAARLFGTKDDLTTVITVLPKDTRVTIIDSDSTYYLVRVEDTEGYIFKRQAVTDNNTVANVDVSVNQPVETPEEGARPVNQSTISRFTYLENKYGTSMAARINSGKIWKGMNGEMVRDSWGNPLKISRVISSNTVKEEWTYKSTVLYLENNKLVNWGPAR